MRFSSSKIAPALNITEAHEKVLYCLQDSGVVRIPREFLGSSVRRSVLPLLAVGMFCGIRKDFGTFLKD